MKRFEAIKPIELRGVFAASERVEDRESIRIPLYGGDIVISAGEHMLYAILSNINYMSRSTEFRALATAIPAKDITNSLWRGGFLKELYTVEDKDD